MLNGTRAMRICKGADNYVECILENDVPRLFLAQVTIDKVIPGEALPAVGDNVPQPSEAYNKAMLDAPKGKRRRGRKARSPFEPAPPPLPIVSELEQGEESHGPPDLAESSTDEAGGKGLSSKDDMDTDTEARAR